MDVLEKLLKQYEYYVKEIQFIVNSFREGFGLGFAGNRKVCRNSPNLELDLGNLEELWSKMMKEVKLKRFSGPFSDIPFIHYIQSLVGLVPKGENGHV